MKKILVDNQFSHGAILHSAKKHRKIHSKRKFVGEGSAPYDWTKPLIRNYTQPIKNQYQAGMCGGEAYSEGKQIFDTLVLGKPFVELSERSFYSQEFMAPEGMTVSAMQDGASFKGLTTFANAPTPVNCTEADAETIDWENPTTLKDSIMRAGMVMLSVPINIDSIAQAIRDYYFVVFCFAGVNNGTWTSVYPQPPAPGQQTQWGHFMCSSPDIPVMPKKYIKMYQSWGASVGEGGFQFFDENFINSGCIMDCFTFVKHTFSQDLKFGMVNDDVKYLQVRLGMPSNTYGFGVFGLKTLAALKSWQSANGIINTGYFGILSRTKMNLN